MNDHNLDDLIIDNIDPKNSKTKSFLTIIALAIVVLIVAIILTKIILKDPNEQLILEEDTELISPKLTLQKTQEKPKKVETVTKSLSLTTDNKSKIEENQKQTILDVKPKTIEITDEFSQDAEIEKKRKEKIASDAKKRAKEKALNEQRLAEEKSKASQKLEKVSTNNGYFIQVGSFTQTPSSRFLSIIRNAGFTYHITGAATSKTKKLLIGPYESRADASTALIRVKDRINKSAFVIKK